MNDSENLELDNEMANLTDAVLSGRSTNASASAQTLEPIVRGLQQLAAPVQPSDVFRSRLTQRLSSEFEAQMRTQRSRSTGSTLGVFSRRYRNMLAAAAVIVLVGVAVLLSSGLVKLPTQGTAGTGDSIIGITMTGLLVVVLIALGVFFWWRERK